MLELNHFKNQNGFPYAAYILIGEKTKLIYLYSNDFTDYKFLQKMYAKPNDFENINFLSTSTDLKIPVITLEKRNIFLESFKKFYLNQC